MSYLIYESGQARIADLHREAARYRLAGLVRPRGKRRRHLRSLRFLLAQWRPTGRPMPSPVPRESSSA